MNKETLDISNLVLDETGRVNLNNMQLCAVEKQYVGGQTNPVPNTACNPTSNSYCLGFNAACINSICGLSNIKCLNTGTCKKKDVY